MVSLLAPSVVDREIDLGRIETKTIKYGCFESFPFRQQLFIFVCQITWFWWNAKYRCKVAQLKEFFFAISVKDRYQLNYFICIKDLNSQTINSLKLNVLYFFIYCCQHQERKTISLDIFFCYQTVRYRTPVFTEPFSWRLHITITYNLPHLRLW
jgi:hypothetical protein